MEHTFPALHDALCFASIFCHCRQNKEDIPDFPQVRACPTKDGVVYKVSIHPERFSTIDEMSRFCRLSKAKLVGSYYDAPRHTYRAWKLLRDFYVSMDYYHSEPKWYAEDSRPLCKVTPLYVFNLLEDDGAATTILFALVESQHDDDRDDPAVFVVLTKEQLDAAVTLSVG